jgi:WXG100 family type VII secretion target
MADTPVTTVGDVSFHVTPEQLQAASVNTQQKADEIYNQLQVIRNFVTELEGTWQGIAYQTFQSLMAEYDIYANMLHDALIGISEGLHGTYINYKQSEETNITNLKGIDSSLPAGSHTIPGDGTLAPPTANLS